MNGCGNLIICPNCKNQNTTGDRTIFRKMKELNKSFCKVFEIRECSSCGKFYNVNMYYRLESESLTWGDGD